MSTPTSECHLCHTVLEPVVNLGLMPLANDLLDPATPREAHWFEGKWSWCPECEVLELEDVPPADVVYTESYPYLSGTSRYMDWHFHKTAIDLSERYHPDVVLEIGANDGGIVQFLTQVKRLAIDPMTAACDILERKAVPHVRAKFNRVTAENIASRYGTFNLVYMANTLRSLVDLGDIFRAVDEVLARGGIFVFDDPYLPDYLDRNEWDQLYSENVWGLTVTSVSRIAQRYGFELFDIDALPTHGGSMRYHLSRKGPPKFIGQCDPFEYALIRGEHQLRERLGKWQDRIDVNANAFRHELEREMEQDHRVVGYAATAKSVTVLNYIDHGEWRDVAELMPCVYDTTPNKVGKLLPGSHIPIKDATEFATDPADLVVLWAYNHANEIIARESERDWLLMFPEVHHRRS